MHVSDLHGHFHPYLTHNRSPFAVLRAFADRRRIETGGRVLFLDGGDALEKGALAEIRSRGEATVRLLDHLGLDARTLGNHDFAWGLESVQRQIASESHAVLASNIHGEGFHAKRTAIFEVGCVRVGVFGLVTNPYDETDERVDAPYLDTLVHEHDPGDVDRYVGVATALVRELRDENVDVVIGLDHLGLARDRALIDHVPGLDLVVSAHDHAAFAGYVQGRHGAMVATGSFLGARVDARVGETTLEIDLKTRAVKLVSATASRVDELRDLDASVQAEVERLQQCFAPDADTPIGDLEGSLGPYNVDAWTAVLDAALRAKFPEASAFVYEQTTSGGLIKGELPKGPVTPQMLADFAFSERQRVGGPGFTAFDELVVDGSALRELCSAPLRERIHRVCPAEIGEQSYRVVIERRPLYAPSLAFPAVPKAWPRPIDARFPSDESAVEVMDVLIDYARARGWACRALDRDVQAPCR